jgi:hypothetical protein
MSEQKVYLDDIYQSEKCEGSAFRAVVMMAQEARFINDQARQGFIELEKKPTTIAMYKFKQNRLELVAGEFSADDRQDVDPFAGEMAREMAGSDISEEDVSEVLDESDFDEVEEAEDME